MLISKVEIFLQPNGPLKESHNVKSLDIGLPVVVGTDLPTQTLIPLK